MLLGATSMASITALPIIPLGAAMTSTLAPGDMPVDLKLLSLRDSLQTLEAGAHKTTSDIYTRLGLKLEPPSVFEIVEGKILETRYHYVGGKMFSVSNFWSDSDLENVEYTWAGISDYTLSDEIDSAISISKP